MTKKVVYLIGPDDADYASVAEILKTKLGVTSCTCNGDRRMQMKALVDCDAICLIDGWWSSVEGHMLQQIAGWLKLWVFDERGNRVPMGSLRSA